MESQSDSTSSPTRILLQTKTHLVLGEDYGDKTLRLRDLICQHFQGRNHAKGEFCWDSHFLRFGHDNHTCFFLGDHGMTAGHGQTPADNPQVLWYRWTGDAMLAQTCLVAVNIPPETRGLHLKQKICQDNIWHLQVAPGRWLKE